MARPLAELTTPEDRFTLAVWRRLRDTAAPLPEDEVASIAATAGLDPDALARRLRAAAERDEDGRLLGLAGLSVANHPHRLRFGDQQLSTWCAWDPSFLAPALGGAARLETADPVTGHPVTVDFVEGLPVPPPHPSSPWSTAPPSAASTVRTRTAPPSANQSRTSGPPSEATFTCSGPNRPPTNSSTTATQRSSCCPWPRPRPMPNKRTSA